MSRVQATLQATRHEGELAWQRGAVKGRRARITRARPAGPDHQVVTVTGVGPASGAHQPRPCPACPWRVETAGAFPAEAFCHSAETAHDMSWHTFACHMAGLDAPKVCAGFLLRGAEHNLAVRLGRMRGQYARVETGGAQLHTSYRAMAEANGVDPAHPALVACRDGWREDERRGTA